MNDVQLISRIGPDGVLTLTVPFGSTEANRDVVVTVSPKPDPNRMTHDEWIRGLEATAGSIPDPAFIRHDQGEVEQRDELP